MKLYCQTVGAILLWSITLPVGTIVPQGGEVKIEVCRVGLDALEIEKQFFVYETPAGAKTNERVCVKEGKLETDFSCWKSSDKSQEWVVP